MCQIIELFINRSIFFSLDLVFRFHFSIYDKTFGVWRYAAEINRNLLNQFIAHKHERILCTSIIFNEPYSLLPYNAKYAEYISDSNINASHKCRVCFEIWKKSDDRKTKIYSHLHLLTMVYMYLISVVGNEKTDEESKEMWQNA